MNNLKPLFESAYDESMGYMFLEHIPDMKGLLLQKELPGLTVVTLCDSNLNDEGLKYLAKCGNIENINLQGWQL